MPAPAAEAPPVKTPPAKLVPLKPRDLSMRGPVRPSIAELREAERRSPPAGSWKDKQRGGLRVNLDLSRTEPRPIISFEVIEASVLDDDLVRLRIESAMDAMRWCYRMELDSFPSAEGTVDVELDLADDGSVAWGRGIGLRNVDTCIGAALRKVRFPASDKPRASRRLRARFELKPGT
jgi:hypothetical protein